MTAEQAHRRLPTSARLVVGAAWASNIGDGIRSIALPLLAATVTDNAALIGATVGATLLPGAILGAPVGIVIDRLDRRRIALVSDLIRIAVAASLLATVLTDRTTIAMVIAAALFLGAGETFRDLAAGALIADVVEDHELEAANSNLIVAEVAGNTLLGPVAGAGLWSIVRALPFALDAIVLSVSAAITRRLADRVKGVDHLESAPAKPLVDLIAACRFTWRHTTLRRILVTSTVLQTTMLFVIGVEVVWALDRLEVGAFGLGVMNATYAIGGIFAGMAAKRFDLAAIGRTVVTGAVVVVAFSVFAYTSTSLPVVFAALFAGGAALIVSDIVLRSARARAAGADHVGRVTGVIRTAMWAGGAIGAVAGGAVAEVHGVTATFSIGAVSFAVTALATAIWPPVPSAVVSSAKLCSAPPRP